MALVGWGGNVYSGESTRCARVSTGWPVAGRCFDIGRCRGWDIDSDLGEVPLTICPKNRTKSSKTDPNELDLSEKTYKKRQHWSE